MKISEEEYKKALKIVLKYERSLKHENDAILKRNNYTKLLQDVVSVRLMNCLQCADIGVKLNTSVIDFVLMDISVSDLFQARNFSLKSRKELRAFLDEYQIK